MMLIVADRWPWTWSAEKRAKLSAAPLTPDCHDAADPGSQ